MIRVFQDRFGDEGNCFAACIASIFEVPLERVPQPSTQDLASAELWAAYMERLQDEFLQERGVYLMCFGINSTDTEEVMLPPGWAILNARSPRTGGWHAVVCLDGEIVHDPHPQGGTVGEWHDWRVFVALDPKKARP